MRRVSLVVMLLLAAPSFAGVGTGAGRPLIEVSKDPTCGCCAKWMDHLRAQGFAVKATNVSEMDAVKDKYRVPRQARSCHTGLVEGYAIEGHVPAADIQRLLKERPAGVIGLAVPGMPVGSPGMEGPNAVPYSVIAFDREGRTHVFATHGR